ncbi:MAG: hypothetical protein D6713_04610 [Deltaproteobacteria bacterium]|nr:MAG: hypothetical protein D6713_04610 [Deltaproteobacteria bacterium]
MIAMCVVVSLPVKAMEFEVRPSVTTSLVWSDNVENESVNPKEDIYGVVTPSLFFLFTGKNSSLSLGGSVSGEAYRKFDELNDVNSSQRVNVDYTASLSERFQLSLSGGFSFTPRAVETDVTEGTTPEGAPLEVTRRSDRYTWSAGPTVTLVYSPRTRVSFSGRYSTIQYSKDIDVTDSVTYSGSVRLERTVSPRLSAGIEGGYSTTDYDEGNDAKVYSLHAVANYAFSRATNFSLSAGISALDEEVGGRSYDFTGSGSVSFRPSEEISVTVSGRRSFTPGGSFGRSTRSDEGRGDVRYEKGKVTVTAGGFLRSSISEDEEEDLFTTGVSGRVEFRILTHTSVFISSSYVDQESRSTVGEDIRTTRVMVGFSLRGVL